jgi:hypothetical protein
MPLELLRQEGVALAFLSAPHARGLRWQKCASLVRNSDAHWSAKDGDEGLEMQLADGFSSYGTGKRCNY